jgi:methyl acetate hydrolase
MVDTSYAVAAGEAIAGDHHLRSCRRRVQAEPAHLIATTPTPPFRGDGGLYSTASDYGRFIRMFLNGGQLEGRRIISQRSVHHDVREPDRPLICGAASLAALAAMARPFPLGAGRDKFGLGFEVG